MIIVPSLAGLTAAEVVPAWVPRAAAGLPPAFADFANQRYWNGRIAPSFAAYNAARGASLSRASAATTVDVSGLVASVGQDLPRFAFDPVSHAALGLALAGSRTNVDTLSEDLSHSSWTKTRSSISANLASAPAGATTADKIVEDTSNNSHYVVRNYSAALGTIYAVTRFFKAAERTQAHFRLFGGTGWGASGGTVVFNLSTGVATITAGSGTPVQSAGMINHGNGWWRCWAIVTPVASDGAAPVGFGPASGGTSSYQGDGASGVYVWGAQWEVAGFVSSYIPTGSAQATRAAEVYTRSRANPAALTRVLAGRTARGTSGDQVLWQMDDGSEANRHRLVRDSSGHLRVVASVGGTDRANLDLGAVANDTGFKVALRVGTDIAASLNGAAVISSTPTSLPTISTERWGRSSAGSEWFGTLASDAEFPVALPDADLRSLSA